MGARCVKPEERTVKVIAVTSGDTIVVQSEDSKSTYPVKLSGIHVPNLKPSRQHSQPKLSRSLSREVSMAESTRFALDELVLGQTVVLKNIVETDIATFAVAFLGPVNVNVWLISGRFAVDSNDPVPDDWVDHFHSS